MRFITKTFVFSAILFVSSQAESQQAAIVHNEMAGTSYVGALEDKVAELNLEIADLNSKLKDLGDRLEKAERINSAINACAAHNPPMVYAGSVVGCVEVKPAPCELCDTVASSASGD